jgi:hypothetical protein
MKTVHGGQDACKMQQIDRRDGNQNVCSTDKRIGAYKILILVKLLAGDEQKWWTNWLIHTFI